MQRLLEIPQEVCDFLQNFRLRVGDWNRDGPGRLLLQIFSFCNRPFLLCSWNKSDRASFSHFSVKGCGLFLKRKISTIEQSDISLKDVCEHFSIS